MSSSNVCNDDELSSAMMIAIFVTSIVIIAVLPVAIITSQSLAIARRPPDVNNEAARRLFLNKSTEKKDNLSTSSLHGKQFGLNLRYDNELVEKNGERRSSPVATPTSASASTSTSTSTSKLCSINNPSATPSTPTPRPSSPPERHEPEESVLTDKEPPITASSSNNNGIAGIGSSNKNDSSNSIAGIGIGIGIGSGRGRGNDDDDDDHGNDHGDDDKSERIHCLMRPFNDEEQRSIQNAIYGLGHDEDIISQDGTDSVKRQSIHTLKPGMWLNDEIIHYFYLMLAKRDEELCKKYPTRQRSHFFKSFFITKILNEGSATCDGKYKYKNVKQWSKKVPGKDIFKLDKILFPINMGNMHWIAAAIFMKQKRIEMFDSMGSDGSRYLNALFSYIQDEHMDKKKTPLPDIEEWKLVPTQRATPRQRNGHDCGVFTCMFADFLSTNTALAFNQNHINHCRERIALSILNGKAIV